MFRRSEGPETTQSTGDRGIEDDSLILTTTYCRTMVCREFGRPATAAHGTREDTVSRGNIFPCVQKRPARSDCGVGYRKLAEGG